MNKLYVTAEIRVDQNDIEKASSLLNTLALNSMEESGCSAYQILKSTAEKNAFITFEVWNSEEAENLHWKTAHLKAALNKLRPLLLGDAVIKKYYELPRDLHT